MRSNKTVAQDIKQLRTNDDIDAALWINFREDPALSVYPLHDHAWGEFIYAFNGIMEVKIGHIDYITPPPYGVWLPPNLQHSGLNRTDVSHGTFYIHESLCTGLPNQPGILLTSPLVTSLLQHLKLHPTNVRSEEHQRLLHVLLDQLKQAQMIGSYLPHTEHPQLRQILDYLHQNPENNSTLQHLAAMHNLTERTLARYCQKELRMSLNEWRQRLKVIKAMSMLKQQKTVENIAFDLGYANASAFIQMFKRWMGYTPDQFRKIHQTS
ncbi:MULTISPECIES: AraC family transcriptional regulator [Acinetobacter]|uniref:HTH araC/xylS-type domain-containing protein n=1 Tax=Acinetobacter schindleri CIP 107287 TaxID=1217988 RepID=N9A9R9_9GAMM|nr:MULTISPECIES: helix-turn-helix transcriptional regulator [Acinetobacter]ENV42874.1 hypothetical protein F955_03010 [Acinetobacter schindleri CIP 107287]ENW99075.1 hypothetical protein F899_02773 [Acinetobacter sp. CIP 101934]MCU4322972.1 helix-turn-helix transcriptional regulator [Acinetobacter schindleri]